MPARSLPTILTLALAAASLAGCQASSKKGDGCVGGKCDDPGSTATVDCDEECGNDDDCFFECMEKASLAHCEARRDDAMSPSRPHFLPDTIRWACKDVDGVNSNGGEDRGQEYCEYFAVMNMPPRTASGSRSDVQMLGKGTGVDSGGLNTSTELALDLTANQQRELEAMSGSEVVGQCIFTSWHQDTPGPLNVCRDPDDCPDVFGLRLDDAHTLTRFDENDDLVDMTEPLFRMTFEVNSNRAAAALVADCMTRPEVNGDMFFEPGAQDDDFVRGCMIMSQVGQTQLGTEWRRSDSSVCAAAMRMFECGCAVDTDRDGSRDVFDIEEIANVLVPEQPEIDDNGEQVVRFRGFSLGTWDDSHGLPSGCRYVDPDERAVVACDISARDALREGDDLKGFCGEQFGNDVVAHLPLPDGFVICSPDDSQDRTDTCGNKPWIVGNETSEGFENCGHDVCDIGASLSPSCGSCEAQICDVDPFCCETSWNRFCTEKAETVCGQTCDDVCRTQHDVCEQGDPLDPTCDPCIADICEEDPFCCVTGWNQFCTAKVERICGQSC